MNKAFISLATLFIVFFIYSFYLSTFEFQLLEKSPSARRLFYDYRIGANIHSKLSIGSGSYESIAAEAKKAKQDFLLFTDVNLPIKPQIDHYENQVGLLFGEKAENSSNRIISYRVNDYDSSALRYFAHRLWTSYDQTLLTQSGLDGMEVFNLKNITQSAWAQSKFSTLWSLIFYPFNPRLALMRLYQEPSEEIKVFDAVSSHRPFVMYLGAEASARAIPITNLIMKFPSYERTFSVASQHLLLTSELSGDINKDAPVIVSALKSGQFYIAFDDLADPSGFEVFVASDMKNSRHRFLGEEISYSKGLRLHYRLPAEPIVFFEVVLYKNGLRVDHFNTSAGQFLISGPGVYRIQVRLSPRLPLPDAIKWLSWIYTNNFYIR
jgi:hypothetical protein